MTIQEILDLLAATASANIDPAMPISGIAYDSRQVEPGFVFVAIPGTEADGHSYIPQAIAAGAVLIVAERQVAVADQVQLVEVASSRLALAKLAAAYYGYPDRQLRLIGVTGTNGKTTTTILIQYLLECAGHKAGLLGTIGARAGQEALPELISAVTTPESLELFSHLQQMQKAGCDYAVMEASSHALHQGRVSACNYVGAVFTNLTQDHLDYHQTMAAYGDSKALLFAQLDPTTDKRYGVVNGDDPGSAKMRAACRVSVWSYGMCEGATVQLLHFSASIHGMTFAVVYQDQVYQMQLPLIGKFNIYNALAAVCVGLAEGLSMTDIVAWLAVAPQVPGRFELIQEGQDFAVVVDYAHTPDGLANLLAAAKALKPRRLITVFGCGGNRDNAKRPIMGRIAAQQSNVVILTSDNPRNEDPQDIIDMVEAGMREVDRNYLLEIDRAKAVQMAIRMAEPGDMVVLAGKGHEDYQIIQGVKHHFDDREAAREALRSRLAKND